jgi:hypothetical protein
MLNAIQLIKVNFIYLSGSEGWLAPASLICQPMPDHPTAPKRRGLETLLPDVITVLVNFKAKLL